MTRDDLAPLTVDDPGLPCECCGGSGVRWAELGTYSKTCAACNGSGYGLPPASADREKAHCIKRLSAWAHRDTPKEEN